MTDECRHARVAIGGDPHDLPADVRAHLSTCEACRQFHAETLAMDGRLRLALELPLAKFRQAAPAPSRRFALAASVVLAALVAGGSWLLWPQPALAADVVEHIRHEGDSWNAKDTLPASDIAQVLQKAGVKFDSSMPVVYASACPFRKHLVPHLVVQTPEGPMTVMLLAHERVSEPQEFSEGGYRGVLMPADSGSVAILARKGHVPNTVANELVSGVRW